MPSIVLCIQASVQSLERLVSAVGSRVCGLSDAADYVTPLSSLPEGCSYNNSLNIFQIRNQNVIFSVPHASLFQHVSVKYLPVFLQS